MPELAKYYREHHLEPTIDNPAPVTASTPIVYHMEDLKRKPNNRRNKQLQCAIAARNRRYAEQTIGKLIEATEHREMTNAEIERWNKAERWIVNNSTYSLEIQLHSSNRVTSRLYRLLL